LSMAIPPESVPETSFAAAREGVSGMGRRRLIP
jgi:hypothetical protein